MPFVRRRVGESRRIAGIALAVASLPALASAQSQWVGGNSGNWSVGSNWSPSGVPGSGATVDVTSTLGATQTITYNYAVNPTYATINLDLTGQSGSQSETIDLASEPLSCTTENIGASGAIGGGSGTFNQSGGGNTVTNLTLGLGATDTGNYILSGGNLSNINGELIGSLGNGSFTQTAGVNSITAGSLDIADTANSSGSYALSGAGTLAAYNILVGNSGVGTFNQTGGTIVYTQSVCFLSVGNLAGATGTFTQSGGMISGDSGLIEDIGGAGAASAGLFNQSGGTNNLNGGFIAVGDNTGSVGAYLLSAGSVTNVDDEIVGNKGSALFNQSGGNNAMGELVMASNSGDNATYLLSGGTLTASVSEYVGNGGTAAFVQSAGSNNSGDQLVLANGASSEGSYTLSGTGILAVATMYDGYGATGNFTQTGGSISGAHEIIADSATGLFNQSGGSNSATEIDLGFSSGSSGEYLISGGTVTAASVYAGGSNSAGAGGQGTLMVSGTGLFNVTGTLEIFSSAGSTVLLSGGTLRVGALNDNSTPGLLKWSGGTLEFTPSITFQSGATDSGGAFGSALNLGSGRALLVDGDETLGGSAGFSLTLSSGSANSVGGTLTVTNIGNSQLAMASADLNAGALVVNTGALARVGGTSNVVTGPITDSGNLSLDGGTSLSANSINVLGSGTLSVNNALASAASISIASGGELEMLNSASSALAGNLANSGLLIGAGQIDGSLTNSAGGQVMVNLAQTFNIVGGSNSGQINLAGGMLQIDSPFTNNSGATIDGFGSLVTQATLTNNGTLAFAGSSSFSGVLTSGTSGLVHLSGNQPNVFFDAVINNGNLTVDAGASGTIYGPYTGSGPIVDNGVLYLNANSVAGPVSGSGLLTVGSGSSGPADVQLSPQSIADSLGALGIDSGATLNLTANTLLINYGAGPDPIAAIVSYLSLGYAGGNWDGTGILSTSVAALDASQKKLVYSIGYSDGADRLDGIPSGQIEILPTIAGDAKLQGNVVFGDFQVLAQYFGKPGGWDEGNFTYGPTIDFGDFQLLAQDFGSNSSALTSSEIASLNNFAAQFGEQLSPNMDDTGYHLVSVPEPAAALMAVISLGILARRRPRRTNLLL